jgi:hypothetical protein
MLAIRRGDQMNTERNQVEEIAIEVEELEGKIAPQSGAWFID